MERLTILVGRLKNLSLDQLFFLVVCRVMPLVGVISRLVGYLIKCEKTAASMIAVLLPRHFGIVQICIYLHVLILLFS